MMSQNLGKSIKQTLRTRISTGETKSLYASTKSEIKANAVHAGPLPPLKLLQTGTASEPKRKSTQFSQLSSWSTVTNQPVAVTEPKLKASSIGLNLMDSSKTPATLTSQVKLEGAGNATLTLVQKEPGKNTASTISILPTLGGK